MRSLDFSPLYRSSIGFDRLVNLLESGQSQINNGYPPYNIELVNENHYRIIIAVSGFAEKELEVTAHDNFMVIKGTHKNNNQNKLNYLYQGILELNFERKFQLAEHIQIKGARLNNNGLLFIELERVVPETLKPRNIEIK